MYERTIISDGASKTWAMTGWRIGFTVQSGARAGVHALDHQHRVLRVADLASGRRSRRSPGRRTPPTTMQQSFLERRDLIVGLLNDVPGVKCQVPGGAFYAWPNVTEACRMIGAADSEEFRKRLLHEAGVAVLADIHFGRRVPGEGQHVRFSYAASNEAIEAGRGSAWPTSSGRTPRKAA